MVPSPLVIPWRPRDTGPSLTPFLLPVDTQAIQPTNAPRCNCLDCAPSVASQRTMKQAQPWRLVRRGAPSTQPLNGAYWLARLVTRCMHQKGSSPNRVSRLLSVPNSVGIAGGVGGTIFRLGTWSVPDGVGAGKGDSLDSSGPRRSGMMGLAMNGGSLSLSIARSMAVGVEDGSLKGACMGSRGITGLS